MFQLYNDTMFNAFPAFCISGSYLSSKQSVSPQNMSYTLAELSLKRNSFPLRVVKTIPNDTAVTGTIIFCV